MAAIALQTHARPTPAGWSGGVLAAMLRALAHWWSVGRHYRPERRYMRGGAGANGAAEVRELPGSQRASSHEGHSVIASPTWQPLPAMLLPVVAAVKAMVGWFR